MLTENPNPYDFAPPEARELPHNIEAEQALLGALLLDNRVIEAIEKLDETHFYDPLHTQIFAEIKRTIGAGRLASPITLKTVFEGELPITPTLTVPQYLGRLVASATSIINAPDYAATIIDLAGRRALIKIAERMIHEAYTAPIGATAAEQIEAAEVALYNLAEPGEAAKGEMTFAQASAEALREANEAYQSKGKMRGLATGFADLDDKLGGLQKTDLIILAGRPSMGKTALATNIAWHIARQGHAVDFRSLEMSGAQLAMRIMAEQINTPSERLRRGTAEEHDIRRFVDADIHLRATPLIIDQTGGITIAQLAQRARRARRKHSTAIIVVDYLQLMRGEGRRREGNRAQEVSEITVGLKALAKELEVPILALSQLSREVEKRSDKRPQLSDLRESGSIEQDADVVMFVYREEYYLERERPDTTDIEASAKWEARVAAAAGIAEVSLGKQRHGPIGTVRLQFDGSLTRFSNLAKGGAQ